MATHYVVCVTKHPYHTDPHTRIQTIGTNESNSATSPSKLWTVDQVIKAIRSDGTFYCTDKKGDIVKVIIATHNGNEYVKTENDGIQPDNLLAKPDCK